MLAKVETKSNKVHTNGHAKKQNIPVFTDNDLWDRQMSDTNSPTMKKLLARAKQQIKNGEFEEGGFGGK